MGYNPNISHLYVGYRPFTNHLLTAWDIQVKDPPKGLKGLFFLGILDDPKDISDVPSDFFVQTSCKRNVILFSSSCTCPLIHQVVAANSIVCTSRIQR